MIALLAKLMDVSCMGVLSTLTGKTSCDVSWDPACRRGDMPSCRCGVSPQQQACRREVNPCLGAAPQAGGECNALT